MQNIIEQNLMEYTFPMRFRVVFVPNPRGILASGGHIKENNLLIKWRHVRGRGLGVTRAYGRAETMSERADRTRI